MNLWTIQHRREADVFLGRGEGKGRVIRNIPLLFADEDSAIRALSRVAQENPILSSDWDVVPCIVVIADHPVDGAKPA